MIILLSSVGRRPYLVTWFKEALEKSGMSGVVIATDSDPLSPSRAVADRFIQAKKVADPEYQHWLAKVLIEEDVNLAISINDFELSEWAQLPDTPQWAPLIRFSAATQTLVEDKFAMGEVLSRAGLKVPFTWLGSDDSIHMSDISSFITKGRFGSASRGLHFADRSGILKAITAASEEVTDRRGVMASQQNAFNVLDLVLVQERIFGQEFGMDVISDFSGNYVGVLARKKISMRGGETDRAESVSPEPFEEIARQIAAVIPHPGTIDVDIIVDDNSIPYVIDINPRFGGGYPFSHLAGADIPRAYISWNNGKDIDSNWLKYEPGVVSGKFVEAIRISEPTTYPEEIL
ncbi:ATP-grasp enzyme-like protein [Corynebacterium glutamicum]|uniref:ATP-grasp domain-containing protein n=1 Tax=Corynebacterium glutamicum TaxID=1718 RepID=UPI00097E9334|nr:ATP-grasp domain-containing protein [Corynebacterium glutamicum]SJM58726.1 ATP-grasp enzyme-like protein [Corynebacterium glutamicum]